MQITLEKQSKLVQDSHCECKAGNAKCSHLVALLYTIAHFKTLKLESIPPVQSKTSQPQKWHVPSRDLGLKPKEIATVTVQKLKKGSSNFYEGITPTTYCPVEQPIPWYQFATSLRDRFKSSNTNPQWRWLLDTNEDVPLAQSQYGVVPKGSVLSYQMKPIPPSNEDKFLQYPSLFESEQPLYYTVLHKNELDMATSCLFNLETCKEIELKTRTQSRSSLWKSVRQRRITASNFHRVYVRQTDEGKLAADLLKSTTYTSAAMRHGIEHEEVAADLYQTITGNVIFQPGFIININSPNLGASPDRLVIDKSAADMYGLLEIKCPQNDSFTTCKYLKQLGNVYKLKSNSAYYHQIQGQLGITGRTWCDFLVKAKDDYHLERINYDADMWSRMKFKLDSFYYNIFLSEIVK